MARAGEEQRDVPKLVERYLDQPSGQVYKIVLETVDVRACICSRARL